MALNFLGLGFVFSARDQASATMNRVGGAFDRQAARAQMASRVMQTAMIGIGASVATMAAGLGTLRGAFRLAEASAEFEQGIARVGAVSRATGAELDQLRQRAIQAGIETQFSPDQATEGLNELAVRGFNARESMTALGGALDLAAGGSIAVSDASQAMGAAIRVFGLEASEATFAADRMLRISNVTALQASDLALALGNVSRGAGLARQGMNEMLPAIGLVRNTGVEASVASNAVSSALIFMARRQDQFRRLGVSVTDAAGNFRPFMDIILDTQNALGTRYTSQAERAAAATELFGRFGVTAFNAISSQAERGVRDLEGNVLRGADALAYLRNQMATAGGAAEEFRNQLLNTFRGQRTLLEGTIQTLGVVLGEPFARAIRPFVTALTQTLNLFIRVFDAMPRPVKTAFAAMVVAVGVFLTAFGGVGIVGFTIALIIPFVETLAAVFGVLLLVMAPMVGASVALGAALIGLYAIFRRNVGGIQDSFRKLVRFVTTGYDALVSLFTRGGLTAEMDKALNANPVLRRWVITIYRAGHRVRQFFRGFQQGFEVAMQAGRPAVDALLAAFRQLGAALGIAASPMRQLAETPSERFKRIGVTVSQYVVRPIIWLVDILRHAVQFVAVFIRRGRTLATLLGPAWEGLTEAASMLGDSLARLFGNVDGMAAVGRDGVSPWQTMAEIFAVGLVQGIDVLVRSLTILINIVRWGIDQWNSYMAVVRMVSAAITNPARAFVAAWQWASNQFLIYINAMIVRFNGLASQLPAFMRNAMGIRTIPLMMTQQIGMGVAAGAVAGAGRAAARQREAAAAGAPGGPRGSADVDAMAAKAAMAGPSSRQMADLRTAMATSAGAAERMAQLGQRIADENGRPVVVEIDGERVAAAVRRSTRSSAAGAGAPTPGFAED